VNNSAYRYLAGFDWRDFVILIISLALITFVSYKAAVTSFTHDESLSFTRYVPLPIIDILTYNPPFTNNHILNTIGMKITSGIFGVSEFSLRFPNIIGLLIYLFFAYRIVNLDIIRKKYAALLLFIILIANPYLIDFFGLARGYGLSVGFMVMTVFYLMRFTDGRVQKDILLFNIGALLAMMANFALVNYYISALIAFNLILFFDKKYQNQGESFLSCFLRSNKLNLVFLLINSLLLYAPFKKIIQGNMIDFGGKEGFVQNTILSLVRKSSYDEWPAQSVEIFLVASIILISTGLFIYLFINFKKATTIIKGFDKLFIVKTILVLVALSTIVQNIFFQRDYLIERFALFLIPLFLLTLVLILKYWINRSVIMAPVYTSAVIVVFLCYNVVANLNDRYYIDWKYERDTKQTVHELTDYYQANLEGQTDIKLGMNWLFEPTINFYRELYDLNWLVPADREGWKPDDDFHYLFQWDVDMTDVEDRIIFQGLESVLIMVVKNEEQLINE
jgi:hypothetical protein